MRYVVRAYDEVGMMPAEHLRRAIRAADPSNAEVMAIDSRREQSADRPAICDRTFIFLMDAETDAELDAMLRAFPMWPVMTWDAKAVELFERLDVALETH